MKNYEYKCVPVPTVIDTGKKGKDVHVQAVTTYETIINQSAEWGWELSHIDTITSAQQPGCFSGLAGAKAETITFKMLIFKKEK